ncbi:MAG: amidase [Gemmatimonadetes bacterium]|nr:amidase [Gemmatimonadota bacterium]NNF13836.1 amidase [Gemmatimonadota bacterium]NNL29469.1 amidase [Gemmatimonadota bacterium]
MIASSPLRGAPAAPTASSSRLLAAALLLGWVFGPAEHAGAQVEVRGATITTLQQAMSSGAATSADITRAYLARIEAYDRQGPTLTAMVWLNPDAVSEAEALDRERASRGPRGPLHGVPVILKDNYDTFDLPTSAGSLALASNIAPDDAFQVARLREAGAVVLGKTNMHELASGITTIGSIGGQTLNPYDLTRNPGGSSGGTGAAIAASFAAVGWGSDTCGSIRIPAAQNNLVGLRPTKGLSSIDGIIPLSHTQDVGGPLARTMEDLAIALDATVGPDPADPATAILGGRQPSSFVDALDADALEGARIGILAAYFGDAPEERAAGRIVRDAIARMVELGADTVTVEIPDLGDLMEGSGLIGHEFRWDLQDYLAANPDAPVSSLAEMLELGLIHEALVPRMRARMESESRDSEEYLTAYAKREPLRLAVEAAMDDAGADALVFPTVRTVPAVIGDPQRGSSCSLSANTGLPSLSIPVGFADDRLPIGMEMIGRTLDDWRLVAIGYALESATDHRREPWSAPSLVDGQAPPQVTVGVRADGLAFEPPVASGVEVRGRVRFDPTTRRLSYEYSVDGVDPADIFAVVLRRPDLAGAGGSDSDGERADGEVADDEEGAASPEGAPSEVAWLVEARLSGPGVASHQGELRAEQDLVEALERGDVRLEVFTRQHPLGAARAVLGLPR